MNDKDLIEELRSQIIDLKIRVKRLEEFYKAFPDPNEFIEDVTDNEELMYGSNVEEAVRLVSKFNTASASFLQRKLSIGYSHAARILDHLETLGIVGPAEGSKPREVLVENAEKFLNERDN